MPDTYQKQALRFEDQLALLQQRGLEFDDLDRALSQIRTISYYRLSGYWHPFRKKDTDGNLTDKFIHGTSFENVIELYEFDRELRLLVMSAIERVEVYLRTLITYHLIADSGIGLYPSAQNVQKTTCGTRRLRQEMTAFFIFC